MVLELTNIERRGVAARMNITSFAGDPTTYVYIRRKQIPGVNWIYATRLKFWMYRSGLAGLDANGLDIRLIGDYPWTAARASFIIRLVGDGELTISNSELCLEGGKVFYAIYSVLTYWNRGP